MDKTANNLVSLLKAKKYDLSVAESCTGGMIASSIVSVSGASDVFIEGLVTYSNDSKIDRLGVKNETIDKYGAVSEQCIVEMLAGLKTKTSIAVSGIAGPLGGTIDKPVGTVYIGIRIDDLIEVKHFYFDGSRSEIRTSATKEAMLFLLTHLRIT